MSKFSSDVREIRLIGDDEAGSPNEVKCAAPTGINVLIVGAGVGGLTAAIECHRQGHSVRVLERANVASAGGDMFTVGSSALQLLEHYPSMQREYEDVYPHGLLMRFRKWTGEDVGPVYPFAIGPPGEEQWQSKDKPPMMTQLRERFHAMLYHQLGRFGIKVSLGKRVVEYYEDVERGVGGVVVDGGERFEADVVVAADGINSRSRFLIPGAAVQAKPTGRTVFRGAFPLDLLAADPLVNETFGLRDGKPLMQTWLGRDVYCVVLSYVDRNGENGRLCMGISVIDPNGADRRESWRATISSEEILEHMDRVEGWGEAMKKLIKLAPADSMIAWPLNPRTPVDRWYSPHARVVQLGDAAHPFLPTSGNGASQAMEDGVSIAACLAHASKDRITTGVKVHNLLRKDRVSYIQLMGFANASRFQKTDWEAVGNDASKVQPKVPKWIWSHHPQQYAEQNFENAAASLAEGGPPFANTNIPTGYVPKPWTVEEVEETQRAGREVELDGDWS